MEHSPVKDYDFLTDGPNPWCTCGAKLVNGKCPKVEESKRGNPQSEHVRKLEARFSGKK